MKPSDLKASRSFIDETKAKPRPYSKRADPPITDDEAAAAKDAICCRHHGLIVETGDKEGSVWFCPIGKQYWRYASANRFRSRVTCDDAMMIV